MNLKFYMVLVFLSTSTTYAFSQQVIVPLKMNVLYVGVDNPISIAMPRDSFSISISEGTLQDIGRGMYNVKVDKPGEVSISVTSKSGGGFAQTFRVKRIPDAVPFLTSRNRELSVQEFQEIKGLAMMLENFDFEARCTANQYEVIRIASNGQKELVVNGKTARFTEETTKIIAKAQAGDTYIFTKIKYQCTGDSSDRMCVQSLVLFIR